MTVTIIPGDCRDVLCDLPDESVACCVTSPPYFGLRDYGAAGQIGLEAAPADYVAELVAVFREVRRVLKADGTLWLNLGDSYHTGNSGFSRQGATGQRAGRTHTQPNLKSGKKFDGLKSKDLMMLPARVAIALQADGWWLRSDIIWHKPNAMPESVTDRPTAAHEHIFLLSKSERYFYDSDAIRGPLAESSAARREGGETVKFGGNKGQGDYGSAARRGAGRKWEGPNSANARNVWTIPTQPYKEAHFATFPPRLAEMCIKAGSRPGDMILDPFGGAGTTALVADRLGRDAVIIELNPAYAGMAERRIAGDATLLCNVSIEGTA